MWCVGIFAHQHKSWGRLIFANISSSRYTLNLQCNRWGFDTLKKHLWKLFKKHSKYPLYACVFPIGLRLPRANLDWANLRNYEENVMQFSKRKHKRGVAWYFDKKPLCRSQWFMFLQCVWKHAKRMHSKIAT